MATIAQTALCIEGAKAHYYIHASYYGIPVPDFDTLQNAEKQLWVERCEKAIRAVGMQRRKVLAIISPSTPWGEPLDHAS